MKISLKSSWWLVVSAFTLILGLVYLPTALRFGYYRDEWYFALDGMLGGRGVFWQMFSIDRPVRGLYFELMYALFGVNILPYTIVSFVWRVAGAISAFWLFDLLWPRQRQSAFVFGTLFAIFPGFLMWISGLEYQPIIASATLQTLSFALTVKAIRADRAASRALLTGAAILIGWLYVTLVEYAVSMEAFRVLCIFVALNPGGSWWQKTVKTLKAWMVTALVPGVFLFWRVFLFENERKATDLGFQFDKFLSQPVQTGLSWLTHFIQATLNVTIAGWVIPFNTNFFSLDPGDLARGLLWAVGIVSVALLALRWIGNGADFTAEAESWPGQAILLGLAGAAIGVSIVVVSNRQVLFSSLSHYGLPASLGGALFMTGLVASFSQRQSRYGAFATLVALAALTHHGLGTKVIAEETSVSTFWEQIAWRAPNIEKGTTLAAFYPFDYGVDVDVVWGPANLRYYPERQTQIPVQYPLAAVQIAEAANANGKDEYRTHFMLTDAGRLLVLSQPVQGACVHVIDPRWPEISIFDPPQVAALASLSKPEQILATGLESSAKNNWCYYYEKAALARQLGDWAEVSRLGAEAQQKGLKPVDAIEWLPFLQAYAFSGEAQKVADLAPALKKEPLYRRQACQTLTGMKLPDAALFCE